MAKPSDEPCVPREMFYKHLDTLKSKQVKKESQITLFIEDAFFDKAKAYLKFQAEKQPWNSIGRSEAVKVGNTDNHKKEVGFNSDDSIIIPNKRKVYLKGNFTKCYPLLTLVPLIVVDK